jgi:UbiD family decarboxylase
MSFFDLREFLKLLDSQGELHRIETKVDPEWEVGAICRENFDRGGPALQFNHVGKHQTPLVVGVLGKSKLYGLALGVDPTFKEIYGKWREALKSPLKPLLLDTGPCKEVKTEEINLYEDPFPVPRWHVLDGGPYLGTFHLVITKDPESGSINCGMYRNQIIGKDRLGIHIANPNQDFGKIFEKWKKLKKSMPVAIAIGVSPYLSLVAATKIPSVVAEYDIAGGLSRSPIEVVRAEASDLLVPACSEIILEGEVSVDDYHPQEGPFGETPGYMGEMDSRINYIKVEKITHRRNPIFQGTYEGKPPNESALTMLYTRTILLYHHLLLSGVQGVKNVCVTYASRGFHTVVSIHKQYPDHAKDVMNHVLGCPGLICKHCVVVDEDVDPWDAFQVEWAIATRVQADRDIEIIKDGTSSKFDVSQVPSKRGLSSWLRIDATKPVEEYEREGASFPSSSEPPEELLMKVRARWKDYGFKD